MKNLKNLEQLQQLHELIVKQATGSPSRLARFMQVSERKIYQFVEYLKDLDAPVSYSKRHKTYYYTGDFKLEISLSVKVSRNGEVRDVFKGSYFLPSKREVAA